MNWKWFLFSLEGRIDRKLFWFFLIPMFMLGVLMAIIVGQCFGDDSASIDGAYLVFAIIFLWPNIAVHGKRWHDRNKSARWILISLVPVIGPIWAFVETGLMEGTKGENRFGQDPLEDRDREQSVVSRQLTGKQVAIAIGVTFLIIIIGTFVLRQLVR